MHGRLGNRSSRFGLGARRPPNPLTGRDGSPSLPDPPSAKGLSVGVLGRFALVGWDQVYVGLVLVPGRDCRVTLG